MIERLNRTYKAFYRPTNCFDNIDGANYDLTLWVSYYNFLRPHKHNNYKVLNDVEMLHGASNMPGKWQLLILLNRHMTKEALRTKCEISSNTIAKLGKGQNVTTDVLLKICIALKCDIKDIMEIVDD